MKEEDDALKANKKECNCASRATDDVEKAVIQ